MKKVILILFAVAVSVYHWGPQFDWPGQASATENRSGYHPPATDAASLELKRQQLDQREAALKAKEAELARLSATLDARVKELNAAKKSLEGSLAAKKQQDNDRFKKMIKIYKGLKPDDAAALMNKLDSKTVIEMLNIMDQKTAVKLIPLLTQPRVLEWTRMNLSSR
ncbi:hypothetical protein L4X63_05615 [Geomonas sp. Red32]|uniref:MotE family protein n=1 Tax=Geomonas sp. Red32 TaxID=2912856 RepID=UPI00202CE3B5|nr:hypothetical protein [Geomonas sp. Red32]MCM0081061.1 hypothetical protein [Geomonas sp. Red32]